MNVLARVRRTIARHALAAPDTRVAVAVSGGSDSVALLHLLLELHHAGDLVLAGIAHFNHQIRPDAGEDERFCADLAATLNLPFVSGQGDVPALARAERWSIERAARTARHAYLEDARERLNAHVIALAHTRDDQAETFLLRLIRGAGTRGLAAMYPRNGRIVRPAIDCSRTELREYLREQNRTYREDTTNDDVAIPRNRVRRELVPLLKARFNPAIVERLADAADVARDEHALLQGLADDWLTEHARRTSEGWHIERRALCAAPRAVARFAIWRALSGRATAVFADVERVLELAHGARGPFDAPRQRVQLIGTEVVLTVRTDDAPGRPRPRAGVNKFDYVLSIPGEVRIAETGDTVSAELADVSGAILGRGSAVDCVAVAFDKTRGALQVRNRRPGDRFRPLGAPGWKKLQDFLVDLKVVREQRDRIPIVVDDENRIVWVAGLAVDEAFRVKDPAQAVIMLRLKGGGGST